MKPWSQDWIIAAGAYPGFCSIKQLEVFLLSLNGMLVHRRSLPRNLVGFPQQFAGTHLYTLFYILYLFDGMDNMRLSQQRKKKKAEGQKMQYSCCGQARTYILLNRLEFTLRVGVVLYISVILAPNHSVERKWK